MPRRAGRHPPAPMVEAPDRLGQALGLDTICLTIVSLLLPASCLLERNALQDAHLGHASALEKHRLWDSFSSS